VIKAKGFNLLLGFPIINIPLIIKTTGGVYYLGRVSIRGKGLTMCT
jgi:hypothetical protein